MGSAVQSVRASRGSVEAAKPPFNGVKVFSATRYLDRERLGEAVTSWIELRPQLELRQMIVTQSSDDAFHCVVITVFYWEPITG